MKSGPLSRIDIGCENAERRGQMRQAAEKIEQDAMFSQARQRIVESIYFWTMLRFSPIPIVVGAGLAHWLVHH